MNKVYKKLSKKGTLAKNTSAKSRLGSHLNPPSVLRWIQNGSLTTIFIIYIGQVEDSMKKDSEVVPLPDVVAHDSLSADDFAEFERIGFDEIIAGRVAVLLMAGGQGTRLGCDDPKGMYDVGLQSGKSLFALQASRLLKLQKLALAHFAEQAQYKANVRLIIPWYIMTSFVTEDATKSYFEKNDFFGLRPDQVYFFNQDLFPCLTADTGHILLSSKHEIAIAPNGNGGLWSALKSSGALADMKRRGVTLVASYGVDNILAKVADPIFIGFSTTNKQSPISCKVVCKSHPEERVGVLCLRDGKPSVIEYSEIDPKRAQAEDPKTGKLLFNAAHIVLNNFTTEFIERIVQSGGEVSSAINDVSMGSNLLEQLPYHIAKKKIPCIDEKGNTTEIWGWKFELFVFDVFEYADSISAIEVVRADEFSPLKNSVSASSSDNPETCRKHLSQLHQRWVKAAGGKIEPASDGSDALFEIDPQVSYFGEGLEELVRDKTFQLPHFLGPKEA